MPRLQSRFSALTSALIVSTIWAIWHIPMFFYDENLMSLGPVGTIFWVIGLMFGSVLLTWLYNNSEGSILMTAIWHGTYNLFTAAVGQAAGLTAGIISMFVMVWVVIIVAIYGRSIWPARRGKLLHRSRVSALYLREVLPLSPLFLAVRFWSRPNLVMSSDDRHSD